VGEDLLLISAVDEADAYSAVGVELLHILKYICVNVIAVRKICRKHDRLLQNRRLGGYYHRKRNTRAQEDRTLGGLIAHVAGDVFEVHPALIGLVNHGKLMGVYDLKIQQLANSRTVKVISSCLALALSEYGKWCVLLLHSSLTEPSSTIFLSQLMLICRGIKDSCRCFGYSFENI
jgi:hypothetical protein